MKITTYIDEKLLKQGLKESGARPKIDDEGANDDGENNDDSVSLTSSTEVMNISA